MKTTLEILKSELENHLSAPFRGTYAGAYRGPNGWYAAALSADGVSHYQPTDGGRFTLDAANRRAAEMDEAIAEEG